MIILATIAAFALKLLGVRDTCVMLGEREHYGGSCEQRDIEVEIRGRWIETEARGCK